jgi:hypothetical protein
MDRACDVSKEKLKAQLEILEWVIKLTYCGMPVSYFRHLILKRHEELQISLSDDNNHVSLNAVDLDDHV